MAKSSHFLQSILVLFSLFLTTNTYSQQQQNDKPYIEVNGIAEKEVIPDMIYINIVIEERFSGGKVTIEDQEKQLKESLQSLGIDLSNLSVSSADAAYVKVNWFNKDVMARKSYSLKVSTADMLGRVYEKLGELNIKFASLTKLDYSKKEEVKKELRIAAIKSAKEKGSYMLEALGQFAGRPIYIRENEPYDHNPYVANYANKASVEKTSKVGVENDYLEFKKIKFTSNVDAKFEIK